MGWNYLSNPKLRRHSRWSLGMERYFNPTLYWVCDYLSILGFKLIHVSKSGPSPHPHNRVELNRIECLILNEQWSCWWAIWSSWDSKAGSCDYMFGILENYHCCRFHGSGVVQVFEVVGLNFFCIRMQYSTILCHECASVFIIFSKIPKIYH